MMRRTRVRQRDVNPATTSEEVTAWNCIAFGDIEKDAIVEVVGAKGFSQLIVQAASHSYPNTGMLMVAATRAIKGQSLLCRQKLLLLLPYEGAVGDPVIISERGLPRPMNSIFTGGGFKSIRQVGQVVGEHDGSLVALLAPEAGTYTRAVLKSLTKTSSKTAKKIA